MSYSHFSAVPIEMLPGIGLRTAKVLRTLRIQTVGQFKQIPEEVLVELFGPSIRTLHQHVRGKKPATKVYPGTRSYLAFPSNPESDPTRTHAWHYQHTSTPSWWSRLRLKYRPS